MDKPSEPIGISFTLGELQEVAARAVAQYGAETKIYGYNQNNGIALHAHFPAGVAPHVTFTQIEVPDIPVPEGSPVC
jgi:hypothetical protein